MISSALQKTALVIAMAFYIIGAYAQETSDLALPDDLDDLSLYGVSTTKFTDKPKADEYIQLKGTTLSKLDTPEAEAVSFEIIRHKELHLFLRMDRARHGIIPATSTARTLARNQEDGFSVKWESSFDGNRFLSILGGSSQLFSGGYYVFVDTNGDKRANRAYGIFISKDEDKSYIRGFSEKEDGSEITSADVFKEGI